MCPARTSSSAASGSAMPGSSGGEVCGWTREPAGGHALGDGPNGSRWRIGAGSSSGFGYRSGSAGHSSWRGTGSPSGSSPPTSGSPHRHGPRDLGHVDRRSTSAAARSNWAASWGRTAASACSLTSVSFRLEAGRRAEDLGGRAPIAGGPVAGGPVALRSTSSPLVRVVRVQLSWQCRAKDVSAPANPSPFAAATGGRGRADVGLVLLPLGAIILASAALLQASSWTGAAFVVGGALVLAAGIGLVAAPVHAVHLRSHRGVERPGPNTRARGPVSS